MCALKISDVLITRRLPTALLDSFEKCLISYEMWDSDEPMSYKDLIEKSRNRKGILCMLSDKIDANIIRTAGPSLKAISTMSVGFNHIDINELKLNGIRLGYTPGILADATAELALSLLLATSRKIVESCKTVPSGEWKTWSPFWMCGKGLLDATVGIVGLGTIGKKIAQRIASFRPSKIFYSGSGKSTDDVPLITIESEKYVAKYQNLESLLSKSDFVILSCLLNKETTNLMNEKTLSIMKPGSILINVSRGEVVDQDALFRALSKSGDGHGLAAAGLDVTTPEPLPLSSPLLSLKNCVITPHIGSATVETRSHMVRMSVENLIAGIMDKPMPNEVKL